MKEIWRAVPGFEGSYEVSNRGRVRSLDRSLRQRNRWGWFTRVYKGQLIAQEINHSGYCKVGLYARCMKLVSVHRLVAQAFIANPKRLPFVDHADGDKQNNNVKNLSWVTGNENMRLWVARGGSLKGVASPRAKLTEHKVRAMRRRAAKGESFVSLGRAFGVTDVAAHSVVKRRTWRHVL